MKSKDNKRGKLSTSELVDYNTQVFANLRDYFIANNVSW